MVVGRRMHHSTEQNNQSRASSCQKCPSKRLVPEARDCRQMRDRLPNMPHVWRKALELELYCWSRELQNGSIQVSDDIRLRTKRNRLRQRCLGGVAVTHQHLAQPEYLTSPALKARLFCGSRDRRHTTAAENTCLCDVLRNHTRFTSRFRLNGRPLQDVRSTTLELSTSPHDEPYSRFHVRLVLHIPR